MSKNRVTGVSLEVRRGGAGTEIEESVGGFIEHKIQLFGGEVLAEVIGIGGHPYAVLLAHIPDQDHNGESWIARHTNTTPIDSRTLYIATVSAFSSTRYGALELVREGIIEAINRGDDAAARRRQYA